VVQNFEIISEKFNICNILKSVLSFFKKMICHTDHATPLYPQKLALTSPTSGGRSVGIVRSRTKATELVKADKIKTVMTCCVFTTTFMI
jgi:hypothetical protein